jgi:hypothetical protein
LGKADEGLSKIRAGNVIKCHWIQPMEVLSDLNGTRVALVDYSDISFGNQLSVVFG